MKIYAGVDEVTGGELWLRETVPAGPDIEARVEVVRTRLLAQVDAKLNARTTATVTQLLDRYFELTDIEENTKVSYQSLERNHIRPLIGALPLGKVDGEQLDSFYRKLRTCRAHCKGRRYVEHRRKRPHDCVESGCREHVCRPLGAASIVKIQSILRKSGKSAVRWKWVGTNPFTLAESQKAPKPKPKPPRADQAAIIVEEAWADLEWGMFIWLAMVTGARRGEMCALKWDDLDLSAGVIGIKRSVAQRGKRTWEKDTKTHQQRRITIDESTVSLLTAYQARRLEIAGVDEFHPDARIFSSSADSMTWLKPDSVSQKYSRLCARLGWTMNIHNLRHYSATELILAGVDVNTVAGRLGHGGGGSTTLKFYTAWSEEADQRAAGKLAARMPEPPITPKIEDGKVVPILKRRNDPASPYQEIAADLRGAIKCGAMKPGDVLPTFSDLAARYGKSTGTAQRAVAELRAEGLVSVSRGRRAVVADPSVPQPLADVVGLDTTKRRRGK
ncbi:tyrosine-type recombinase/integrase [Actinokineospora alba]|uniref:tyrosine-type recombinase/integrase n=1 Tax=Actinokineospora alba TaxID=504798 RepID=UPI001E2CD043|nr:tyrosine-type recombinase/integrase [Actinokineospora alba]